MTTPARFSPAHDAVVSTTVRQRAVTYKVSEHKVGNVRVLDGGEPIDVTAVEGLSETPITCERCQPRDELKPKPAAS